MRNVRETRNGCDVAFETILGEELRVHHLTGRLRHEEKGRGGRPEGSEGQGGDEGEGGDGRGQQQVAHGAVTGRPPCPAPRRT